MVMFSSCPVTAFVAGLNTGGSSRSLSLSPLASGSPASVPCLAYSFHAEPEIYPRMTHSMGNTVVRRQSIARPEISRSCPWSAGTARTISAAPDAST